MKDDWRQDADLAHGLIQEAKGMAGDGIITDHLDAAENHIDRLEARIEALTAEVERKDAALRAIDRMNDHPIWFRWELNKILESAALQPQEKAEELIDEEEDRSDEDWFFDMDGKP